MIRRKVVIFSVIFFSFVLLSCGNKTSSSEVSVSVVSSTPLHESHRSNYSWNKDVESVKSQYPIESSLYPDFFKTRRWGGTVSHHLLTAAYIDQWFFNLAEYQEVSTFIIISPRHWPQGNQSLSISLLPWETDEREVSVDQDIVDYLQVGLDIPLDPTAFNGEHGIGALIPFIDHYFPDAKVVPIVQQENPLVMKDMNRLAALLLPVLKERDDVFLIISTDFSHHEGREITDQRDQQSTRFFEGEEPRNIFYPSCDNLGGMVVLSRLCDQLSSCDQIESLDHSGMLDQLESDSCKILAHTDSARISGVEDEDITSYFFTYF